jgi:hypothetical protein
MPSLVHRDASSYSKVVGSGPFPLPGERARLERADSEATELMENLKQIELNSGGEDGKVL